MKKTMPDGTRIPDSLKRLQGRAIRTANAQGYPDVNMPLTRRESIKNKIAELTADGLNSNEIAEYMPKITKGQLIRVIKDYQEGLHA